MLGDVFYMSSFSTLASPCHYLCWTDPLRPHTAKLHTKCSLTPAIWAVQRTSILPLSVSFYSVILPLGNIHATDLLNRDHRHSQSLFPDANALRLLCSSYFMPCSLLWDTHLSKIMAVLEDRNIMIPRQVKTTGFYTPLETSRPTLGQADKPQLQLKSDLRSKHTYSK